MTDILATAATSRASLESRALVCDPRVLASFPDAPPGGEVAARPAAVDPVAAFRAVAPGRSLQWTERLLRSLEGFLANWTADDLAELGEAPLRAVAAAPGDFALATIQTLGRHLVAEIEGVVRFLGSAGDALSSTGKLVSCTVDYNLTALASYVTQAGGPPPSSLREYCPEVEPLVQAWDAAKRAVTFLLDLDAAQALEKITAFLEGLIVAGAELAADPRIKAAVFAFAADARRLGQLVGTVIGFVIWQVISTVLTAGLGKVKELGPIGKAVAAVGEATLNLAGPAPSGEGT